MQKKISRVSFPSRWDFLRTGTYDFAGAIFHIGETAIEGQITQRLVLFAGTANVIMLTSTMLNRRS